MTPTGTPAVPPARRRVALYGAASALAAADLAAKAWAERSLSRGVELGPIDLRLAFNPGVAFSVGRTLPAAVVVVGTALVTAAVAILCWRIAPQSNRGIRYALAMILGGALSNLVDRALDGVVTDYLHTGWWPTFNLADTVITLGAGLLVVSMWGEARGGDRPPENLTPGP